MILPHGISIALGGTFSETTNAIKRDCDDLYKIEKLSCDEHKKADTRILAHIAYSAIQCGSSHVVVNSTDTDIIVLCLYNLCNLQPVMELWIHNNTITYLSTNCYTYLQKSITNKNMSSLDRYSKPMYFQEVTVFATFTEKASTELRIDLCKEQIIVTISLPLVNMKSCY